MTTMFECRDLTKRYGDTVALDSITLSLREHSVIGLIGRNGSGKTTLMHHVVGLCLPTTGRAETFGCSVERLGADQLRRIGYVPQETRFLDWMTVDDQIEYVAGFYPAWDRGRRRRLCEELDLDGNQYVGALSAGNVQKLALVLAVCHHPDLLIVDEPAAALDPIARARLLAFLLELIRDDETTIVISSHVLRDIEQIVDHVLCLDEGRVVEDADLDTLQGRYATWTVTPVAGGLPERFLEPFVLRQQRHGKQVALTVRSAEADVGRFCRLHSVDVEVRPMNLEEMFPLLVSRDEAARVVSAEASS